MLDAINWLVPNRIMGEPPRASSRRYQTALDCGLVLKRPTEGVTGDSSTPAPLPDLETIDLQGFRGLTASDLFEVLVKHPNLRTVHLKDITLRGPGEVRCPRTDEDLHAVWRGLLLALSAQYRVKGGGPTTLRIQGPLEIHQYYDLDLSFQAVGWEDDELGTGPCTLTAGLSTAVCCVRGEYVAIPVEGTDVFLQAAGCLTAPRKMRDLGMSLMDGESDYSYDTLSDCSDDSLVE